MRTGHTRHVTDDKLCVLRRGPRGSRSQSLAHHVHDLIYFPPCLRQTDKNISLSVAEVKVSILKYAYANELILSQALTCYGSGEDEESNPSNDDDSSAEENPQTEINKEKSPDSSNSR